MSLSDPLFQKRGPRFFSEVAGPLVASYVPLTNVAQELYRCILAILDKCGIRYFLFAGSLVGYVRDGQMPPWLDDIDVIIFEDQIAAFERDAVPALQRAGFVSLPQRKRPKGGRHLVALREAPRKDAFALFTNRRRIKIPRVQMDVFYTRVNEEGILENLGEWGLYHRKKIPVDWVLPGQKIQLLGRSVPTFSAIAKDVFHEYGDVQNNVVIYSHRRRFLELRDTPWHLFAADFARNENAIKQETLDQWATNAARTFEPGAATVTPAHGLSFVEILKAVVSHNAGTIVLSDASQWFWAADLKKLCSGLNVVLHLKDDAYIRRAIHMLLFADQARCSSGQLMETLQHGYAALTLTKSTDKIRLEECPT